MTLFDAVMLIVGVAALLIGCIGKTFYFARSLNFVSLSSKRAPTWQGRLMFICVGLAILAIEVKRLVFGNN